MVRWRGRPSGSCGPGATAGPTTTALTTTTSPRRRGADPAAVVSAGVSARGRRADSAAADTAAAAVWRLSGARASRGTRLTAHELDIAPCDTPGLGVGTLRGDGECGTDRKLDIAQRRGRGRRYLPYRRGHRITNQRSRRRTAAPSVSTMPWCYGDCSERRLRAQGRPDGRSRCKRRTRTTAVALGVPAHLWRDVPVSQSRTTTS